MRSSAEGIRWDTAETNPSPRAVPVAQERAAVKAPGGVPFLALEAYHYLPGGRRVASHHFARAAGPRYLGLGTLLCVLVLLLV